MNDLLYITRNYPPLVGGMERLALNVHRQLQLRTRCDLVGPQGCRQHVSRENDTVYECRTRPLAVFLAIALYKSLFAATRRRYGIILAGSGLTALIAVLSSRVRNSKCATFVHGLDLVADSFLYRRIFIPAIARCDLVIANSSNTAELAVKAGVARARIRILHPGVELPDTVPDSDFRVQHGIGDRPVLLSAGRLIPRKGIVEFIRNSLPDIARSRPDILLVIIGSEPRLALNKSGSVATAIRLAVRETGLENNVLVLGETDDHTLQAAYGGSTLLVFPLRPVHGDVEGFGMVAVEAAAAGLPCVAFAEGGVVDAVDHGASGYLVESGNYNAMTETILKLLDGSLTMPGRDQCREHAARFRWETFGARLDDLITELGQRPELPADSR